MQNVNPNMHLDWEDITERYIKTLECNDRETMREVAGQIKISAGKALVGLQNMGKERFLSLGYDLSLVEQELGSDWIEQYDRTNQ